MTEKNKNNSKRKLESPDAPEEKIRATSDMTSMREMMVELFKEWKEEMTVGLLKEIKEGQNVIMSEIIKIRKEKEALEESVKKLEVKVADNNILKEKISKLEMKLEEVDKRERKNNILIKNLDLKTENKVEETKIFFKEKLNIETKLKIIKIWPNKNGEKNVLIKVDHWEKKKSIMKNKHKLKNSNIYIQDDLTINERKIQQEIVERARNERKKGKTVFIKYKSLCIDGKWWNWNDKEKGLISKNE
ncbi:MAG: hypothetical protein ACRCTJ_05485 [Brevinema sp.]